MQTQHQQLTPNYLINNTFKKNQSSTLQNCATQPEQLRDPSFNKEKIVERVLHLKISTLEEISEENAKDEIKYIIKQLQSIQNFGQICYWIATLDESVINLIIYGDRSAPIKTTVGKIMFCCSSPKFKVNIKNSSDKIQDMQLEIFEESANVLYDEESKKCQEFQKIFEMLRNKLQLPEVEEEETIPEIQQQMVDNQVVQAINLQIAQTTYFIDYQSFQTNDIEVVVIHQLQAPTFDDDIQSNWEALSFPAQIVLNFALNQNSDNEIIHLIEIMMHNLSLITSDLLFWVASIGETLKLQLEFQTPKLKFDESFFSSFSCLPLVGIYSIPKASAFLSTLLTGKLLFSEKCTTVRKVVGFLQTQISRGDPVLKQLLQKAKSEALLEPVDQTQFKRQRSRVYIQPSAADKQNEKVKKLEDKKLKEKTKTAIQMFSLILKQNEISKDEKTSIIATFLGQYDSDDFDQELIKQIMDNVNIQKGNKAKLQTIKEKLYNLNMDFGNCATFFQNFKELFTKEEIAIVARKITEAMMQK